MIDEPAIRAALTELQVLVEGDGASMALERLDQERGEVSVRLDLSEVGCLDCVLPAELLADIIGNRISSADPAVKQVAVLDPRTTEVQRTNEVKDFE